MGCLELQGLPSPNGWCHRSLLSAAQESCSHLFPARAHPSPQTSTLHGTASLPTAPFSHELCFINSFCVSNPTSASSAQNCHSAWAHLPHDNTGRCPPGRNSGWLFVAFSILWLPSLGDQVWAVCCAMPGNTCCG